MSADFWAGYISGAVGIIIGNPLDVLKVRLQAGPAAVPAPTAPVPAPPLNSAPSLHTNYIRPFLLGTAAPVLGYGALNALLFVSYNRTEAFLNSLSAVPGASTSIGDSQGRGTNLLTTWLAGAVGGLATWVVSTPTELVKCRAQVQHQAPTTTPNSRPSAGATSWAITKHILTHQGGIRGLYAGGAVTALRDSIGYGFYFWGYELCSRWMLQLQLQQQQQQQPPPTQQHNDPGGASLLGTDAARVLLCGGLAGIITWASIFPLDVVKTRVQTQDLAAAAAAPAAGGERTPLVAGAAAAGRRKLGAWEVAKETYREGGIRAFFRGLGVCSARAFIVNAVQWAVYEWIMAELGQGRSRQDVLALEAGRSG
ncbi:2bdbacc8-d75e-4123-9d59-603c9bc9d8e4 [Thermothielavioides terrestris]|jgi:solute carrier family 25 carnitine/acylcarnitine transporter 20/29|uniref:Mitochondrial carrier-like protein n=2 Tax=Thermothielavioides terrestris TaxID=2587410 RepID=G2R6Q5_THETT|nr:uncharacterized protein THITE_2116570 [Thermothielavioides terrestris NRRL 8126]AEO67687.1 hypothetical protein THITE_2116570 [Thermothielavioides terrestris NRRL 8126]SPQ25815.1 2bdbacc8-d75e-4123-9d59-603c9bc9d8e4 [Thermothielavioides terrestris]